MRALNTNSLKWWLSSTNAIDKQRKKFMHAYEASRSPQASTLHWNSPGFHKRKKIGYFSNGIVYMKMDWEVLRVMYHYFGLGMVLCDSENYSIHTCRYIQHRWFRNAIKNFGVEFLTREQVYILNTTNSVAYILICHQSFRFLSMRLPKTTSLYCKHSW